MITEKMRVNLLLLIQLPIFSKKPCKRLGYSTILNHVNRILPYHILNLLNTRQTGHTMRHGYLLIELMITIVLISCMGLLIGRIQGYCALWHQQAESYLKAATIAESIFAGNKNSYDASIGIEKNEFRPSATPFIVQQVIITIPCGSEKKKFSFVSGKVIHESA
jgi:hypothetical protein